MGDTLSVPNSLKPERRHTAGSKVFGHGACIGLDG